MNYQAFFAAAAAEPAPQSVTIEQIFVTAKDWVATNGLTFIRNLLVALIIFSVGRILANWAEKLILKLLGNRHVEVTASRFMANIVSAVIMVLVIITALGQLGIPTAQFAALIAAAGLAIGLALQGNLSNFAAGFLIIFFRPFKKGDTIAGGGTEGVVDEVQVFTTIITTPDNKRIIVPNSKFTGDNITNFTVNATRRVDLTFVAGAQNDISAVRRSLEAALAEVPKGLKQPAPDVILKDVTGRLAFDAQLWCKTVDVAEVREAMCEKVGRRFAADGIGGPIPLQVYRVEDPAPVAKH